MNFWKSSVLPPFFFETKKLWSTWSPVPPFLMDDTSTQIVIFLASHVSFLGPGLAWKLHHWRKSVLFNAESKPFIIYIYHISPNDLEKKAIFRGFSIGQVGAPQRFPWTFWLVRVLIRLQSCQMWKSNRWQIFSRKRGTARLVRMFSICTSKPCSKQWILW